MSDIDGGYESFPHLHADYEQVGDYAVWPREALDDRLCTYVQFVRRGDLMPRAQDTAAKIINHLLFEISWRDSQELGDATI